MSVKIRKKVHHNNNRKKAKLGLADNNNKKRVKTKPLPLLLPPYKAAKLNVLIVNLTYKR